MSFVDLLVETDSVSHATILNFTPEAEESSMFGDMDAVRMRCGVVCGPVRCSGMGVVQCGPVRGKAGWQGGAGVMQLSV